MKRLALICLFLLAVPTAWSQDWAKAKVDKSPRHRETVTIKYNGRSVDAFVAYPEAKDKRPVVLVIHEIFGLSDWAEDFTDQLAEAGYVAIAPDLLTGTGANGGGTSSYNGTAEVGAAINKLPPDQITADLNATADWAKKQAASNGTLYVIGFCWGGGQSFRFATNRPDLAGAFVFYGVPPAKEDMARIKAPVYGFYAGNDARISGTVPATQAAMAELGKKYEAVIYDGAGHGFMRAGEDPAANDANKKAHDQAWDRLKKLLGAK